MYWNQEAEETLSEDLDGGSSSKQHPDMDSIFRQCGNYSLRVCN